MSITMVEPTSDGRVLAPAEAAAGLLGWAERGLLPDAVIRFGIRRLLDARLRAASHGGSEAVQERLSQLIADMAQGPMAVLPEAANAQHYEVPAAFYRLCLGSHLKYSAGLWPEGAGSLDQAEERMLALSCARAGLCDGQDVLELGCGWGSLTLWIARRYPRSRITAVSNSHSQRAYILEQAAARGLGNLEVITCDIATLALSRRFDRVVSVECFEHLRNYQELLRRIAAWLKPDGCLFVHIFTHVQHAYLFATDGDDDWLARHFFTGGMMPSDGLLLHFQDHLRLDRKWRINGRHYARTARAWLDNLGRNQSAAEALLSAGGRHAQARIQLQRWRMFFMACEELWGYDRGEQWLVSHYRFTPRTSVPHVSTAPTADA